MRELSAAEKKLLEQMRESANLLENPVRAQLSCEHTEAFWEAASETLAKNLSEAQKQVETGQGLRRLGLIQCLAALSRYSVITREHKQVAAQRSGAVITLLANCGAADPQSEARKLLGQVGDLSEAELGLLHEIEDSHRRHGSWSYDPQQVLAVLNAALRPARRPS